MNAFQKHYWPPKSGQYAYLTLRLQLTLEKKMNKKKKKKPHTAITNQTEEIRRRDNEKYKESNLEEQIFKNNPVYWKSNFL